MCAGNLVKSETFSKTFIGALPTYTTPATTSTTTTTTTTTATPTTVIGSNQENTTTSPQPLIAIQRIWVPDWYPEMTGSATRPPLPNRFSTSSFSFDIKITRKMLPSCKVVVYYIRRGEVVADQTEIDVVNEFENQVSDFYFIMFSR